MIPIVRKLQDSVFKTLQMYSAILSASTSVKSCANVVITKQSQSDGISPFANISK